MSCFTEGNAGEKLQAARRSPARPKRDVADQNFGNVELNTEGANKDKLQSRM
jgi:hypothetical protein